MEPFVGAVAGAAIGFIAALYDHNRGEKGCAKKTLHCPFSYGAMAFGTAFGAVIGIVASIFGS